jgi:hypothetical protein
VYRLYRVILTLDLLAVLKTANFEERCLIVCRSVKVATLIWVAKELLNEHSEKQIKNLQRYRLFCKVFLCSKETF